MVIPNTYPSLSNIVHTDFELGRVMCTVAAADPGITDHHTHQQSLHVLPVYHHVGPQDPTLGLLLTRPRLAQMRRV